MMCALVLIYFDSSRLGHTIKTNCIKLLSYCWSRDKPNFDVLEKGLWINFPPHFVNEFLGKTFLILYYINCPNLIVWLPLLFDIWGNICNVIACFPGCNAIDFEINFSFLIKPFFYTTNKSKWKFKYPKNKKSFKNEIKGFEMRKIVSDLSESTPLIENKCMKY